MAVITRAYSEVDGAIAEASSVNKVIDALYTLQDGNISSQNVVTSIAGPGLIKDSAITLNKISDSSITTSKISSLKHGVLLGSSIWNTHALITEVF